MMGTLLLLPPDPVQWAWGIVLFWLALGFASLLLRDSHLLSRLVFPLGALGALCIAGVGMVGLSCPPHPSCCPSACPTCLSICGWTPCPPSSWCCWAAPRSASRCMRRVISTHGRRPAGAAGPVVPPVPRWHGHGAAGQRCLRLHGGLGSDGAVILFPGHHRPRGSRNSPCRFSLSADRARRRSLAAAHLRRVAGRPRRLHLRHHATGRDDAVLGLGRVPAGAVRFRRQGGHWCRCMCGCRKPTRRRPRRCPR